MKYKMRKFRDTEFGKTRAEWERQLNKHRDEVVSTQYTLILDYADTHVDYDIGAEWVYGIFEDGAEHASALAQIIYRKAGKGERWVKMLDLHLAPELDLMLISGSPDLTLLADLYGAAIVGTTKLTFDHPANVVKLYARSHTSLNFFKFVAQGLQAKGNEQPFAVSIEGHWLVVRAK